MSAPRVEADLARLHHNAHHLVARLGGRGISVTGVTKAVLGSPEVAATMRAAGIARLGDSRIENIEGMRRAGVPGPFTLIRSPMPSQADRVVASADVSLNTEAAVVRALSAAAVHRAATHMVVLMVELGDLREGILPGDLLEVALLVESLPGVELHGLGTNLACQSGTIPSDRNMAELTDLVGTVERAVGRRLDRVSGGNSANLPWVLGDGAEPGRIDDLRLGEAILLGREPVRRTPIDGLHTDAFTLVGEVIESKRKPTQPWGELGQTAFENQAPGERPGRAPEARPADGRLRTIVALGEQDTDPAGLLPPPGCRVLGASSDHLVLDPGPNDFPVGSEVRFQLGYGALVRAMTSPFVATVWTGAVPGPGAARG